MKHIKQPNFYTCYVASLAMCIDSTVEEIVKVIGHDGSKILDKNASNQYKKLEMFEPNSIMLAAHKMGYSLTELAAAPQLHTHIRPTNYPKTVEDILCLFPYKQRFILITVSKYEDEVIEHAIAYENGSSYYHDPILNSKTTWPPIHPVKYIIPVCKIKRTSNES